MHCFTCNSGLFRACGCAMLAPMMEFLRDVAAAHRKIWRGYSWPLRVIWLTVYAGAGVLLAGGALQSLGLW